MPEALMSQKFSIIELNNSSQQKNFRFAKKISKTGKSVVSGGSFPVSSVIFGDQQFAAYEDLNGFKAVNLGDDGLSLDCIKLALKVGALPNLGPTL